LDESVHKVNIGNPITEVRIMDEVLKVMSATGLGTVGEVVSYIELHWDMYSLDKLKQIEREVQDFAEEFGPGWAKVTRDQLVEWYSK